MKQTRLNPPRPWRRLGVAAFALSILVTASFMAGSFGASSDVESSHGCAAPADLKLELETMRHLGVGVPRDLRLPAESDWRELVAHWQSLSTRVDEVDDQRYERLFSIGDRRFEDGDFEYFVQSTDTDAPRPWEREVEGKATLRRYGFCAEKQEQFVKVVRVARGFDSELDRLASEHQSLSQLRREVCDAFLSRLRDAN